MRNPQIIRCSSQRPAGAVDAYAARNGAAKAVGYDAQGSGDRGTQAARIKQLGIIGCDAQIDRRAAYLEYTAFHRLAEGPQVDDPASRHASAIDRGAGKPRQLQPRTAELSAQRNIADIGTRQRTAQLERFAGNRAAHGRVAQASAGIGGDRDRTGDIERIERGQPPQAFCRPAVAQLREQAAFAQPVEQHALCRQTRDPGLDPATLDIRIR